jgi:ABC-type methionine transport system permease subunit
MNEVVVWLIIAAFYAPLHFGGPLGVVILIERDVRLRRRMIRYMLLDCALSMLTAFTLVIWLAGNTLGLAMAIMLLSMLVPYLLMFIHHSLLKAAYRVD